ncbi:MAG: hypothetical protein JNK05_27845 [Myxococcales bacterium]|nr:hypothetical protein [Myxococcales bacterium]
MVEGRIRFELPDDHFETVTGDSLSFHVPRYCSMAFEENSIQVVSGYCRVKQTVDPNGVVTVESEIDASTHAGARLRESSRDYDPPLDEELNAPPAPIELFGRVEGTLHVEVSYRDWFDKDEVFMPQKWGMSVDGRSSNRDGLLSGVWSAHDFEFVFADEECTAAWNHYFEVRSWRSGRSLIVSVDVRNWVTGGPPLVQRTLIRANGQRRRLRDG